MASDRATQSVVINAAGAQIGGELGSSPGEKGISHRAGIIIFAHGSGSSRLSPRNQYVASILEQRGLARRYFLISSRPRSST